MGATAHAVPSARPVQSELEKIIKLRSKEDAGVTRMLNAAATLQNYVKEETDKKKKAEAKKQAKALSDMANKMSADFQANTRKMQEKMRELGKLL